MSLRASFVVRTDVGRVRARNEDTCLVEEAAGLTVVADGMGGHPGGDVASAVAADAAAATLRVWIGQRRRATSGSDPAPSLGDAMARCALDAHESVRREAARRPELPGMGTTLTAFLLHGAARRWGVGHVGDSRAYLLRDGVLEQLTRDDTWVQAQVEAGALTPQVARGHPAAHVLQQCVGLDRPPEPHVYTGEARPRDRFLLCSDGLTDMLEDAVIRDLLVERAEGGPAARALVEAALERGGVDNVTVVLVAVDG